MGSLGTYHNTQSFWRKKFTGYSLTPFPAATLPINQLVAGATVHIKRGITIQWPKHSHIAPSALIRASWALVLGRMANSHDVVFGVPASSNQASIEMINDQVAPTTSLIPIRASWDSSWTVLEYLDIIYHDAKDMMPFERTKLENIAGMSSECRQASELQTLLIVQSKKLALSQPPLEGWKGRAIVLHMLLDEESIIVRAHFDPRAIASWEMRKALERFEVVLQQLRMSITSCGSEKRLSELEFMTKEDLLAVWEWNQTVLPSVGRCVHKIIESHAISQPAAVAVCAWDGDFTYRELDHLSTMLSYRLINAGVGRDILVPLCFEKSKWTIVALFGVLKAGGGFILLDPSLPEQRLRSIVQQTQQKILLCSATTQSLSERLGPAVLLVSSQLFSVPVEQHHPSVDVSPDSVLYVVFTSGSTGTPKGAMISHRNFASAMEYQLKYYLVDSQPRIYDFSSYSFIVSIGNMLIALTAGGCICIPSEEDKKNRLSESITSLHANIIHLTPSAARLISPDSVPEVQLIIFSGEGLHVEDVRLWWGKARVLNVFGLSECAPRSAINFNATAPEEATRIGRGVGQVTWVVDPDDHGRLAPIGCIGELMLEGPLVGLGYLNEPERTAQSFIREPLWLQNGYTNQFPGRRGRLYKTGDLVRYDEHGNLSYIGRKDSMVKIRGQRVELGEVEYRIKECKPDVEQVVADVIIPQGEGSRPILVAFLQASEKPSEETFYEESNAATIYSATSDIRTHLSRHLPHFMVPSMFFSMKNLPKTATGKMDRRRMRAIGGQFSLQQLAEMKAVGQGLKRKPKTRAEIQIQMLWSQSLDIDATHIGLDDSFLQLGGDSIGAMKLVGEAQKIGLGLTVAGILGAPNLERLASEENSLSLFHDVSRFELLPNHDVSNTLEFISQSYGIDLESIEDVYPCTPLQQGIFMLSSSQGEYITQRVLALDPNIDKDCFCRTWKSIATKTELLRTRFVMDSRGTFLQLVSNEEVHFTEVGCLDAYLKADRSIAMSMGQPLARFALVRNSTGAYTHFILTAHHGIYDGWSLRLIIDAADAEYQNQSQGFQPKFNSFIKYINMQDKQEAEAYWRNYLKDYDGTVFPALPPTVAHSCIDSRLRSEFKPLKDKAQTATLSNLIRAAWALVMGRHLDSQDVVFGVPVSGRSAPVAGIDKMRAPTIATVPVRGRWEGNWTLADYLRTLQQQALAMIPFEQTGLHRIAKTCNESRNACRFQTLLLIQPHFPPIEETMGKWVVAEYQELNTYALTLEIKLAEDKITAYAGFDSRAIDSWVVKGLLEQLHSVLLQLSSMEPTKCVSDVNFITPGDLETIWTWNNSVPNSVERCVHEMIVERAEVSRELPAVCAWNGQLTYGELHQLSTALAWKLLDLGLHRGCLVPLCFEKSVWTIVTLLAVCKAGCAFVLLDPSLPEQRLHGIIRQLNPSIMLSSHACHYLSTRLLENVIVISSDFVHEMGTSPRGPLPQVNPKSTMYVVFTSGSTGTPKGTVIRHNNLASAISHQMQQYKYGNDSRVFDFASYSFDMAVFVVFHTLASGSCLCVPNEDERKSNLAKSINSLRADTLILTPSVTRALNPDEVPRIKSIMWIGEALNVGDVEPWWKKNVRLLNGYGPAECTPISTISADASTPEEVTNIGKGIGHTTWVVDPNDHDSLVPIGYVGELLLEGPLVGCGYLNDPDKTSAAFIKDPIWLLKGSKAYPGRHGYMYKTGDLVKYNEDGVLTYLGRKDAQVKIRGQRVELGEVEHHLKRVMPKINQVAVEVIFPDANAANSLLVAFVQMGESVIDSAIPKLLNLAPDVEQKLGECLPNYMLPALLVVIANLPMTATGKTDRKELKAIGQSFSAEQIAELRTSSHQSKRQPASHTEVRIQRIWSQVLNINTSKIGIDDSFIQLGGDSITAMQVSSLARAESMDISSTDILRVKTIAALATRLGDSLPLSHIVSSLHESSNTEPFQMSPMQNLHVQLQTDPAACYDQAFYLQLNKKVTQHDLSVALIHIIDRHSMLRARFSRTESGHWQQRISTDAEGSCSLQLWSSTNQDTPAAISQCRSLLNIYEGPLVSALLFDDDTQTLFISIHHLVVDFVSWRVILRELEELLISETISTPLSLNFRSWVDMQAKYSNENLKAKPPLLNRDSAVYLHYWGMEAKENLALGTVTETFAIDEAVTSAILGHCNTAFSTRPMELMIAALIYSFGVSFPARRDPLVLNEGHGREAWEDGIDISTTVGWFTTMLPIKISSGSVASLEDIILLTKDCVRSFSHNGWADFTSRYANSPEAAISAKGLPAEILFNYAGLYQQLERDGGLFGKLPLPSGCEPLSRQQVRRFSLFEIGARVENHRLSVSVAFHKDMSHQQEIRGWIQQYRLTIMQMSAELSQLEPTWTLSDFPGAFESYDELREFVNTQLKELSVKPSEVEDIFPCSPLQEGILASKTRDSRNYQARFTMRVKISEEKPSLDVGKLEQSWAAVTQKHSLLRSLVVKRRSKCQRSKIIVLKSPVPAFSCEKTQFASAITMSTTNDWVPLKQDELQYRLTIYHVNAREAYLRLDISHAIMDGFSMQILWDEFKASYSGTSVPSGDFKNVVNHLQKHPEDAGFQFWKRYLENVKPCLAPPSVSIGAKFVEFKNVDVPIRQYLNMKDFCQKCDVTAATLIQVAWAIVLGHLTGATTPCFGNVYSGRDLPIANVNKTFGPLIGMAPCRVVLDGNKSVLNVLEAAQSEYLDSLPHQHFPLKRIHEALCLGSSALFNTIISFQRSPDEEERPHDTFSLHCLDIFDPNEYDITVRVSDGTTGLKAKLCFRPDFLSLDEMDRLVLFFGSIIDEIIVNPTTRISDIKLPIRSDLGTV